VAALFQGDERLRSNYKRILLKLSGEALGTEGKLFDNDLIERVANVLLQVVDDGVQLGVVVGAGNIWRGRQGSASGMNVVTADQMGMLGTVINCLYIRDVLERTGRHCHVLSAIEMPRICETFTTQNALRYLRKGHIVLFAAGSGNPLFSTDTAAILRAVELDADAVLLAKNIDGVYSDDPRKDPNAKLIPEISYQRAQDLHLKVMDTAAFSLCAENKVPVVRVFSLSEPENILEVIYGGNIGTTLYP
jgi:uridylate kinase